MLYDFASNLEAKQIVCFYIDTFSFHLNRQGLSPCQLVNLSTRLLVNSLKNKIFAKTVNHLVACVETSDLQGVQFLIYTKNHLVIVWTIQLSSDENIHNAA